MTELCVLDPMIGLDLYFFGLWSHSVIIIIVFIIDIIILYLPPSQPLSLAASVASLIAIVSAFHLHLRHTGRFFQMHYNIFW